MPREPRLPPAEKPFAPFPPSHPVLPPNAPKSDPARDVPPAEDGRSGNGVHPHAPSRPPVERER